MELQQQVCSLELAKKLKELGVKQESYFVYYPHDEAVATANRYFLQSTHDSNYDPNLWPIEKAVAAFTVAELGEMLPISAIDGSGSTKATGGWNANYYHSDSSKSFTCGADTEADARAKMLIYLIENKLITV